MKYLRDILTIAGVAFGVALIGLTFLIIGVILVPFSPVLAYNLEEVRDE